MDDRLLFSFPGIHFTQGNETHPYYLAQFKKFWEEFSHNSGTWIKGHFDMHSLLLYSYLLPETNFLPEIKLYLYTDLSPLLFEHTKNSINNYF